VRRLLLVSLFHLRSELKLCSTLVRVSYAIVFLRPVPEGRPKYVVILIFFNWSFILLFRRAIMKTAKVLASSDGGLDKT
jgi:hypothetical protein